MWMQQQGRGAAVRPGLRTGIRLSAPEAGPAADLPAYEGPFTQLADGSAAKPAIYLPVVAANDGMLPAVLEEGRARVAEALFVCSQGPTGRGLLQKAQELGYRVAVDDGYLQGVCATALCDPGTRTIYLNTARSTAELANALDHECTHVVQNAQPLFANQLPYTPVSLVARSRATEADAIAHEVQCAWERAVGDAAMGVPGAPANGYTRADGLEHVRTTQPDISAAWLGAVEADPRAATDGRALAAAHEAFYKVTGALDYYEDATLRWIESWGRNIGLPERLRVSFTDAELKGALTWNGKPYLVQHASDTDLTDSAHAGLSDSGVERVRRIQAQRPAEAERPASWWVPSRGKAAAPRAPAPV